MVNRIDVAYMYRDYTREILASGYKMYVGGTQTAFTSAPSEIKTLVSTYIIGYAPIIVNELFVPTIVNFRQYYVWYVICPWLSTGATINGYIVTNP